MKKKGKFEQRRLAPIPVVRQGFPGAIARNCTPELKFVDQALARAPFAGLANSTIDLVNGIAIGSDYTQRVGRQVTLTSCHVKLQILPAADATTAVQHVRVLLVLDMASNSAATPAIDTILASATADPLAFPLLTNRARYKIIRDGNWTFGGGSAIGAVDSPNTLFVDWYVRFPGSGVVMNFTGTGNAQADIQGGALYIVCLSNAPATADSQRLGINVRTRFRDC